MVLYDLVLIATCTNSKYVNRLLDSVISNNQCVKVLFVLVLQNSSEAKYIENDFTHIVEIIIPNMISLSKARNIALEYLIDKDILYRFIMFPDDDSSYDSHFFNSFIKEVKACSLIDVYGTNTNSLYKKSNLSNNQKLSLLNYRNAMSVNMIIDYTTVEKVGFFDENLGVGNYYGAGEDADYYIRCINAGASFYYLKSLWNFHPMDSDKNNQMSLSHLIRRYRSYGRGQIYMLLKHNLKLEALKCVFSALFGSIIALFKLDLKLCLARSYAFLVRLKTFLNNL